MLSGISIGHVVKTDNHKVFKLKSGIEKHKVTTRYFDLIGVGFYAFLWEAIEHYLKTGLAGGGVENWLQGVEFWGNRIIADPLLLVVGYLIAKKYPQIIIPARILSLSWLMVHIFIFLILCICKNYFFDQNPFGIWSIHGEIHVAHKSSALFWRGHTVRVEERLGHP